MAPKPHSPERNTAQPVTLDQLEEPAFLIANGYRPTGVMYDARVRRCFFEFGPDARPPLDLFRQGQATIEPLSFVEGIREAKTLVYRLRPPRRWVDAPHPGGEGGRKHA